MEKDIVPYDCIIIVAGPAGITATIYLVRKKLDILLLTNDDTIYSWFICCWRHYRCEVEANNHSYR